MFGSFSKMNSKPEKAAIFHLSVQTCILFLILLNDSWACNKDFHDSCCQKILM